MTDAESSPQQRQVEHLQTVAELPGGVKVVALNPEQLAILEQMLDDRMWWKETVVRLKQASFLIAGCATILMFIAMWWPWLTRIMQAILRDVPPPN